MQTALGFHCYFPLYILLMHHWKQTKHKLAPMLAQVKFKWMNSWNFLMTPATAFIEGASERKESLVAFQGS